MLAARYPTIERRITIPLLGRDMKVKIDLPKERLENYTVRAYFGGHLYPEKPTGGKLDLKALESQGITDVLLNEPEVYL